MNRAEGSARGLITWALIITGAIALVADLVDLNPGGLAIAGAALILIAFWIAGVFTHDFWTKDIDDDQMGEGFFERRARSISTDRQEDQ